MINEELLSEVLNIDLTDSIITITDKTKDIKWI